MKSKALILSTTLFVALLFSVNAFSQDGKDSSSVIEKFNASTSQARNIAKALIGTATIELRITFKDSTEKFIGVKTVDGEITEFQEKPYEDATLKLYLSESALEKIASSENPISEFQKAWGKEIRIERIEKGQKGDDSKESASVSVSSLKKPKAGVIATISLAIESAFKVITSFNVFQVFIFAPSSVPGDLVDREDEIGRASCRER